MTGHIRILSLHHWVVTADTGAKVEARWWDWSPYYPGTIAAVHPSVDGGGAGAAAEAAAVCDDDGVVANDPHARYDIVFDTGIREREVPCRADPL